MKNKKAPQSTNISYNNARVCRSNSGLDWVRSTPHYMKGYNLVQSRICSLKSPHFGIKWSLLIGLDLLSCSAQWSSNWWSLWSSSFMFFNTTFISFFFFDRWIRWSQSAFMPTNWKFSIFYLKQVPVRFPLLWFEPTRLPPWTMPGQRERKICFSPFSISWIGSRSWQEYEVSEYVWRLKMQTSHFGF